MCFIRIIILTLLLFQVNTQLLYSQRATPSKNPYAPELLDSLNKMMHVDEEEFQVNVRILPNGILEKYKNDPDFNYDNKQAEVEDWITKIKNWINQQLALLRSSKAFSTALDYLYYALAIAALILIIRGLIKADRRGLLFGKLSKDEIKLIEQEEDINQLNFDELISSAMDKKQFKLAIRYLFLKSLKLLSDRDLIRLKDNKTNYEYLQEIKNSNIAEAFRNATFRFEWIWYGDFPIDDELMKNSQNDFNNLFRLISA